MINDKSSNNNSLSDKNIVDQIILLHELSL